MCVGFEPPACLQPIDHRGLGQFDRDQWGTELARAFDSELEEFPDTGASLVGCVKKAGGESGSAYAQGASA
jgi:hypothetical protein